MRCRTTSSPSISIRSVLSSSGVPPASSSSTASEQGGTSGRPRSVGSADKNLCMMSSETHRLLFVADGLHDLPHFHRIARGNFLDGHGQLIGRDAGEVLEHRPQLLERLGLFRVSVATPQNTVQCRGGSLFTRCISRALGIGQEDHSNEPGRNLHDCRVYPGDFLRDFCLLLVGHKSIFGDSGIQRHSRFLPNEKPAEIAALAISALVTWTDMQKSGAVSLLPGL